MGTKRNLRLIWLMVGLVFSLPGFLHVHAQQSSHFETRSPNVYKQPPTQSQYQPFPAISTGFRQQPQEDPFGENQGQKVKPQVPEKDDQFEPFQIPATDPPKQQQEDPFGEGQVKPEIQPQTEPKPAPPVKQPELQAPVPEPQLNPPVVQPSAESKKDMNPSKDPFADPAQQEPTPPADAQINPQTTEQPASQDPGVIDLQNPTQENQPQTNPPQSNPPQEQTSPPGTIELMEEQVSPPSNQEPSAQSGPTLEPNRRRSVKPEPMDYYQGKPLKEYSDPLPKFYWPQPEGNVPPIVAPNRYAPYQTQPRAYVPPPKQQPLYKPDYQPIPGLRSQPQSAQPQYSQPQLVQPQYAQPQYVPAQPSPAVPETSLPPVISSEVFASEDTLPQGYQSQVVAADAVRSSEVYSDVVTESCVSGCQPCNNGCSNFYFSVFGGFTDLRDLEGYSGTRQMFPDNGGGVGVALGRRNGRNLRTEAEFSYRSNSLLSFVTSPVPMPADAPVSGELNSYAGMANAYWEFIDVPTKCFKPYVGVGVGFIGIDAQIRDSIGRNIVPSSAQSDTSFAYQWIGGVNYKAYRNMDFFAEYRMLNADTYRIDPSVPGLGDRYTFKTDNVFMGLRWKF